MGVSSEVKTRLGRCDPSAHKPTEPGRPLNKRAPLFQQPSECPATFQVMLDAYKPVVQTECVTSARRNLYYMFALLMVRRQTGCERQIFTVVELL